MHDNNHFGLEDMDFNGMRVLLRLDLNVPLKNGVIGDETRIREAIPTVSYLLQKSGSLLICSHLGRPQKELRKGKALEDVKGVYSLRPIATRLSELLEEDVFFLDFYADPKQYLEYGLHNQKIVLFENLRFNAAEEDFATDRKGNMYFAEYLADFAEVYVNDAFAALHRAHASISGIPQFLPSSTGLLVEKELGMLSPLLKPESPAIAIIGGAKIKDKVKTIENLTKIYDKILLGGALANDFLKAKGYEVGSSLIDKPETAKVILKDSSEKIVLPVDVKVISESGVKMNKPMKDVANSDYIIDVGRKTVGMYEEIIADAKTVFWNGPLGLVEKHPTFATATRDIGYVLAKSKALATIGGGDTIAVLAQENLLSRMGYVSTGGGATLEFLAGEKLPGLKALEDSYEKFS